MKKHFHVVAAGIMAVGVVGITGNSHGSGAAAGGHGPAGWSYEGASGPESWGALGFPLCGQEGKNQSPVALSRAAALVLDPLQVNYRGATLSVVNNGHTIQVNQGPGSGLAIGGQHYDLAQFHFHGPSEHTKDGQSFPMEVHLVHKSADGTLAVIGILIKIGQQNPSLSAIWKLPRQAGEEIPGHSSFNVSQLLPADLTYYHYKGSLTTPPCSENVNWFVLQTPIELSQEQFDQYRSIFAKNNRPVQPLNGRILYSTFGTGGQGTGQHGGQGGH